MSYALKLELDEMVDEGWVSRRKHPTLPLFVYCYTRATVYAGYWNEITILARGLVLDSNGVIVGKSFSKFFNHNEPQAPKLPKYDSWTITEKIDGTLINKTEHNTKAIYFTKGSFENEYIDELKRLYSPMLYKAAGTMTVVTEIVTENDSMLRVVKHEPGLYFLGKVINTSMADEMKPYDNCWIELGGMKPKVYVTDDLEVLLHESRFDSNTEGYVVRLSNGSRIKFKTLWYLKMHKNIYRLEQTTKNMMASGTRLVDIYQAFPEELENDVKEVVEEVYSKVDKEKTSIIQLYNEAFNPDRKVFAEAALKTGKSKYLFALHDNKDITNLLIKDIVYSDSRDRVIEKGLA